MKTTAMLICAAALLSAATVPSFADTRGGPDRNQVMMLMSDGTTASMAMPTDKMMMHKMMMGAHRMKGCIVMMNVGPVGSNRGGMYYMMASDKQCESMSKG
jgi:hypothetical protein